MGDRDYAYWHMSPHMESLNHYSLVTESMWPLSPRSYYLRFFKAEMQTPIARDKDIHLLVQVMFR